MWNIGRGGKTSSVRVLILSCNTGEGHNSCAKAIKEVYDAHSDVCEINDALAFISKRFSRFISWGHSTMYRHLAWLFKWGYGYSERHPGVFHEHSAVYKLLTSGSERLYQYIADGNYDTVICVHVFSSLMLTDMVKKHPMGIKTCFVATDYTCSPSVQDSNLDVYFIPDESLTYDFEYPNIPKSKMVGSGIPIRQMFYKSTDQTEAKRQFDISPEHKHLLIMCGSMGCGPLKRLAKLLCKMLETDCEISIVCGTNQKLQKRLERKYEAHDNFHIRGFVKDMSTLMDSADLYLTKPGGLSVSEACIKRLPMVCIDAVAGCEEYNRRYFVRMGGAKTGANVWEIAKACQNILTDDARRQEMHTILNQQPTVNSSECIYSTMKELSHKKE